MLVNLEIDRNAFNLNQRSLSFKIKNEGTKDNYGKIIEDINFKISKNSSIESIRCNSVRIKNYLILTSSQKPPADIYDYWLTIVNKINATAASIHNLKIHLSFLPNPKDKPIPPISLKSLVNKNAPTVFKPVDLTSVSPSVLFQNQLDITTSEYQEPPTKKQKINSNSENNFVPVKKTNYSKTQELIRNHIYLSLTNEHYLLAIEILKENQNLSHLIIEPKESEYLLCTCNGACYDFDWWKENMRNLFSEITKRQQPTEGFDTNKFFTM